ncbi:M20 family peptidase [Hyalangium rubrum]|uniref:M20 family peptidase n=1 Tax=Hyalangium rubrum TaxID=3103134 RepID=A0ABU5HH57_9BACT|nr:M20 family peptidase [Hyalangium sp. s54d21]MDY7232790.1 M20 family peptidase [Hyalangium sp. s54d21]
MGKVAKSVLGLLAALVLLLVVILVRTATYAPPAAVDPANVQLAPAVTFDRARAAEHLSQAIQIPTISHQDPSENQPAEWERLHAWLQTTYPSAHAAMTRELVAGHTLVYTWKGTDANLSPIVLMAHQDVVPVTKGTEKDWKHPPFAGVIAEGSVWGRGTLDNKGSLVSIFEALEALALQGFSPRRTVMLVLGHDEEANGLGAQGVAALFKSRGITAEFVLDEGMVVISDNPITRAPLAIIGVAEKGYATLVVTAQATGGHSSTPPKETGVTTLARAVTAIVEDPFPLDFQGPGAAMVRSAAAHASFPVKMAVANTWLFEPLLVSQVGATPEGAALLHTTIAPTMLKGSPKENVLPQEATAWINYRFAPGDASTEVMARAKAAVGDLPVTLSWTKTPNEASPVSSTTSESWKALAAVAGEISGAPVAPGLVLAGTDSRYLQPVAKDVYRFQPIELTMASTSQIHGTNEHLSLEGMERMVQFYARLIATTAR